MNHDTLRLVFWELTARCNLTCKHCYSTSADVDFPGELSTEEVYTVMDDLRAFGEALRARSVQGIDALGEQAPSTHSSPNRWPTPMRQAW